MTSVYMTCVCFYNLFITKLVVTSHSYLLFICQQNNLFNRTHLCAWIIIPPIWYEQSIGMVVTTTTGIENQIQFCGQLFRSNTLGFLNLYITYNNTPMPHPNYFHPMLSGVDSRSTRTNLLTQA